ncbi:hypothetical protein [Exiguobacterium sp. LL15]|uniref:hypothetical protein n=1 Tax=Exiguobacterium sp. LL15 TaxID=2950547 RepID=UPI00210D2289|nr:hypothetical protein [Exiguobacterium sp. LL15]MCQ4090638.1 hypothetical protein [Exiguobacterium sp. LL15]
MVKFRRNASNIILGLVSIAIIIGVFVKPDLFLIDPDKDFHKDIITLSSVFGGFSFTTYGIIIGLSSQKIMRTLERMGYTSPYYVSVSISLFTIVISLIFSLTGMFITQLNGSVIVAKLELATFMIGVLFFISSIFNVLDMQKVIRNEIKNSND